MLGLLEEDAAADMLAILLRILSGLLNKSRQRVTIRSGSQGKTGVRGFMLAEKPGMNTEQGSHDSVEQAVLVNACVNDCLSNYTK